MWISESGFTLRKNHITELSNPSSSAFVYYPFCPFKCSFFATLFTLFSVQGAEIFRVSKKKPNSEGLRVCFSGKFDCRYFLPASKVRALKPPTPKTDSANSSFGTPSTAYDPSILPLETYQPCAFASKSLRLSDCRFISSCDPSLLNLSQLLKYLSTCRFLISST